MATIDAFTKDPLVFLIPVIAAVIGWGTNVLAVEMMFRPLRFIGIGPLGWQGIVPRHARKLAAKSTDLITSKLINLRTLFEDFDASGFAKQHLDRAVDELTDQILSEAERYAGDMWKNAPDAIKSQVRTMLRAEIEQVAGRILADIGENIEDILDVKAIVVDTAERDRALVGRMFQETGAAEFRFIKRSGAYFGFLFGIVQMVAWVYYPAWWVLPFFGFVVGYATNWLAIKLIFEPAQPKRYGPFVIQGLFHKRQHEVAQQFAAMLSKEILNTDAMVAKMVSGPGGERLFAIVDRHVTELLDRYANHPMTAALLPADKMAEVREEVLARLREELPKPGGFLYTFTARAIDIYGELFERMSSLDSESFEGVLRPAFQEDEWKLIVAGAALGLGAGVLQLLYMFGDSLA
ncbi:MAG: DUF445 family protein [Deltaproteobacteria bacterium]|nr:MAG: DUF445 family protein [Deltaproteobacteria bacterium]